ncbi:MAG: class I SAM-dependent rRNA methyltransferase [Oscillospiraceae bacterium]|nr:class I SAM-dependent rRNA methyltransferase [Oscillospiraceae bacterium]MDD7469727.1 class I SAM-dependent rRNA methyltransferase [Oscillospiraceae bacterium]
MSRSYPKVFVTKKGEAHLKSGHPWVFEGEVTAVSGEFENGDIADVYSSKNRYLGSGYINSNSKIRVRVISKNANDKFDEAFYKRRLKYAVDYRRTVMGERDFKCCRLIFGEADLFPGLTVDRFSDVLSVQVLSLGIEKIKHFLIPDLVEILKEYGENITAVYERNDVAIRELEGMEQYKGFFEAPGLLSSREPTVIIEENGIKYEVDFVNGQKTGFFLDQKYNRLAIQKIAAGKTVLDCFTHTGAFALNAYSAGAKAVTAVDISGEAIEKAKKNAELNGFSGINFVTENVFDLLTDMKNGGKRPYDFIILDPPAFTKSSSTVSSAYRGYKEINLKAMKLLPRGGYLATCSCSHFMTDELFRKMLADAAGDADVSLREVEVRKQSPDHPILMNVPETEYLKFYIFQVV